MPLGREQKLALWSALPEQTLRRAAEHNSIRGHEAMSREQTLSRFAGLRGDTSIRSYSWQLEASELKKIAAALGYDIKGLRRIDDLRLALFDFIDSHGASKIRRRARRQRLAPKSMSADALLEIARGMATPVLHLRPEGPGRAVAIWHEPDWEREQDAPELWLSVDLSAHPNSQSSKVLELYARPGSGETRVVTRTGRLPRAGVGRTKLFAHQAKDLPTLDVIFLRGPAAIETWLEENEWKRDWSYNDDFPDAEVAGEFAEVWRAEHPLCAENAWAQLGGWPMTWPEEDVRDRLDDVLMVRTYRHYEPWLEVFRRGKKYLSRSRIT